MIEISKMLREFFMKKVIEKRRKIHKERKKSIDYYPKHLLEPASLSWEAVEQQAFTRRKYLNYYNGQQ
ncbi:hypothetical protein [Chelatococcus asaccharovorans]|uniref:Uncharacterized protein n=1 Tax=Chelatococcus asaccharovorans TaxID=28210 RepID=A0A2V3U266_9HYPH|nr:hypothetical protein [Chelatococcus asaccharovorans]MBS7707818.1 hypothetical protein [Chelatococcus asaccharovorans]PXW50939.1 hypothetical protein C7450_12250 [Chelatococcus asaccharovorans]